MAVNSNGYDQLYRLVCSQGGSISNIDGDRLYQFNNQKEFIKARSFSLGSGISFNAYKLKLDTSLSLHFELGICPALHFLYCTSGSLKYGFSNDVNASSEIIFLQTAIVGSSDKDLRIEIGSGVEVGFALIKIQSFEFVEEEICHEDKELIGKIFEYFSSQQPLNTINHQSSLNLNINTELDRINTIEQRGIVRKLMTKGMVHCVLAYEILNFQDDLFNEVVLDSNLSKEELDRVNNALNGIVDKPDFNYSVKYLSENYLLSATKLQEGFKTLTNKTIAQFIIDQRLIYAEELIRNSDLGISEIVYKIGFSSLSYFSKIFKNKYGCTPKYYSKQVNLGRE